MLLALFQRETVVLSLLTNINTQIVKNTNTMVPIHRYLQPPTNTDRVCLCSFSSNMTFTYKIVQPVASSYDKCNILKCVHACCYIKHHFGEMFEDRARCELSRLAIVTRLIVLELFHFSHACMYICTSTILVLTHSLGRSITSYRFHKGIVHRVNEGNVRGGEVR